jgi:hypothetical protein
MIPSKFRYIHISGFFLSFFKKNKKPDVIRFEKD